MKIISESLITKDKTINTKQKLFAKIADLLLKQKIITSKAAIINDLEKREQLGSTAFENGLMIPHARSSSLDKIKLVIVEFADSDFGSIDGKRSNFAVSIIVPEKQESKHLTILSQISALFSTADALEAFKKLSKKAKVEKLNKITVQKIAVQKNVQYDFVAVTSCAAGIAHTYMARDALIAAAQKMNLEAKVETRGATTENKLSEKEIDQAQFVIIAADVDISKKPFLGKKILEVSTNAAIKDSAKLLNQASKQQITYGKGGKIGKLKLGTTSKKNKLAKSIMYALSFMIPIAIVGGILMAIPNALAAGGNAGGGTWKFPNDFTEALWNFGHIGLILMVPIFAMFLAFKIGGKPAIPASLIGGFFINDGALMGKYSLIELPSKIVGNASAGFLGGLVVGICVGYLVRLMRWIKWHRVIAPISNLMLVPLISSFLVYLFVLYVVGSPMTWAMAQLYIGLSKLNGAGIWASIGIGILFAALMAIDLGGPINKTTLVVATIIFVDTLAAGKPNFTPQTAVQAAIAVPPLGMWLATVLFRRKFSETEKAAGTAALPMGLVGITEGALPFAFKTPIKAILANVSGAAVAGGLVTLCQIKFYGGLGSPLGAYIGYVEHSFYGLTWIASILAGVLVTAFLFGFLTNKNIEHEKTHNLIVEKRRQENIAQNLTTRRKVANYRIKVFFGNIPSKIKYGTNPKNWIQKPNEEDNDI